MRKKSSEKKQAILNAALTLFKEKGFQKASMSEVALLANCSKATLYQYYDSKEQLFYDATQLVINNKDLRLFEDLYQESNIESALLGFGISYITLMSSPEIISIYKMLMAEADRNNIGKLFYNNGREKEYNLMSEYLIKRSSIKIEETDAKFAAIHFFALIESEHLEKCIMGVESNLDNIQITLAVKRAVVVFMSAYGIR